MDGVIIFHGNVINLGLIKVKGNGFSLIFGIKYELFFFIINIYINIFIYMVVDHLHHLGVPYNLHTQPIYLF